MSKGSAVSGSTALLLTHLFPQVVKAISKVWVLELTKFVTQIIHLMRRYIISMQRNGST
jgi:hypothetical protein